MLIEGIIRNNETEIVLQFKEWEFSFPNSPDYEYLANEDKLIIEYKGNRIVEFTFFLDRLHIASSKCLLSVGIKNISIKSEDDSLHNCFI